MLVIWLKRVLLVSGQHYYYYYYYYYYHYYYHHTTFLSLSQWRTFPSLLILIALQW